MQDEEILRLNAEFEHAASREMELRNRLEQSLLTLQIVERDLQASDRELRSQLEHSLTLMRKAENDVRMAEKNVESLEIRNLEKDRELESLEIRNREKDRELESHYVMFQEKDIVILKQGEELKQAAAMRLRVMKELEQMGAQAELMAQMRDEVSRLKADLDSAEARSAELLKQADHLSSIAIQMTQRVAAHEKREVVTMMERGHACRLAVRNRMLLGFTALLLNFESRNCLGDVCDFVHANRSTAVKRIKCQAVFCAWQKNIQQSRRAEGIVARALALRTHRAAAGVFEGWHIEALEQRREEARQNRVLERHLKRRRRLISCQCLDAWRNHTVDEMRQAASIIRMMLLMIERSLAFAFHAWYNSAQGQKRAKDDMELTNRCIQAEGDLKRYQTLLALSNKRLDITQLSIDAVIQASAGCAEALEAGRVKNFQRMSSLEMQLHDILKVSNAMRQKHQVDHQQLRCWFRADISERILEVDSLSHEMHESKTALQSLMDKFKDGCRTLIDKVIVRWDHLEAEIEKLASIRDRLQEALAAEKQRCADLDSLCKREQQDCQDLEKALEDVSRRLLQTDTKFHLAEAQNKELRDSLTFVEGAQARIKILEAYNSELLARLAQSNQQSSHDNSAQNHESRESTWGVGGLDFSVQQKSAVGEGEREREKLIDNQIDD
jgi:hypothetical protein